MKKVSTLIYTVLISISSLFAGTNGFVISVSEIIDASCSNAANGSVAVNVSGGVSPFTYSISGGALQNNGVFAELLPGDYSILAYDATGCSAELLVTISAPPPLVATIITQSCDLMEVSVSGGTPPYTYEWNDPNWNTISTLPTAEFVSGPFGIYKVIVTDANGCAYDQRGRAQTDRIQCAFWRP